MRDIRLAVRSLRATPIVTFVAILSLALGIGGLPRVAHRSRNSTPGLVSITDTLTSYISFGHDV